jgi:putative Mg2+ transporter-C (MgtC) family protein
MDIIDIALRLGAAMVVGGALGMNRDLQGKPTGLRTLSLVALGSALAVMAVTRSGDINAISRVIQGTLTGIGFLGAGVIVRTVDGEHVHGLTTAACTWLTACVGVVCGVAEWQLIVVGVPLVFAVLHLGGPIEHAIHRWWRGPDDVS